MKAIYRLMKRNQAFDSQKEIYRLAAENIEEAAKIIEEKFGIKLDLSVNAAGFHTWNGNYSLLYVKTLESEFWKDGKNDLLHESDSQL